VIGNMLTAIPVYLLWALPAVGWLMLCSAWARSKPFLWAVLIPVLASVMVSMIGILPGFDINYGKVCVDFHGKLTQGFHPILSHPI